MAAIAAVSVNDGKPTPVSHVFTPDAISGNVARWYNRSPGIPLGFEGLSVELTRPQNIEGSGKVYRCKIKLSLPTLEVTSPTTSTGIQPGPTLSYTTLGHVEFVLPARSTTQDREDIRVMLSSLLLNAQIVDAVDNLANVY